MTERALLETERLVLCPWKADDLYAIHRLHSQAETNRHLSADGHPWTVEEAQGRLDRWRQDADRHSLAKSKLLERDTGAFVGRAGFSLFEPTDEFELGYTISPEFRGRGYATEIASALADAFLAESIHSHFIAFASVENHASLKVLGRIGMVQTHIAMVDGMQCQFYSSVGRTHR